MKNGKAQYILSRPLSKLDINEHILTKEKRILFLQTLALGSSVSKACHVINISRTTAYRIRKKDPDFRSAWDDAVETGTDKLEDTALNRAEESSDQLLMFLLKGRRPSKFAERRLSGNMDSQGNAIEYDDKERAIRLVNFLTNVMKKNPEEVNMIKKIEALELTEPVKQEQE